jgi:crotonobetainyl-CoA:carnitine CoA-transferase CaiB-like acyl-CoA transferase
MYQPLKGIKVLDCTRLLPYQYCTMMLGDLGAEVLKVEEPREGDYGRWGDGARTYESDAFVMANRNKKSMKLNLKHEMGREILKKLAEEYDVLVESFRPGVMDRLGVGYKDMKKVNPSIIYCSTTGFGQTGPYKMLVGHDINYLGYSGILACTGEQTGRPVTPGIPIGDMAGGGLATAMAILAAIVGRERSGIGQYIDVGQADVLASLNIRNFAEVLAQRKGRTARPVDLRGFSNCYNAYKTSDGKFMAVGPVEAKFWANFCQTVGKEEWIERHLLKFEEGSEASEDLKELFASKTRDEWTEIFQNVDSCITPVLSPEEALENEHYKARGMVSTMDDPERGETLQIGFPAKFSDDLNFKRSPAPFFGEHTDEVLTMAGYSEEELEKLRKEGVIEVAHGK